jgi:hypothetical protein
MEHALLINHLSSRPESVAAATGGVEGPAFRFFRIIFARALAPAIAERLQREAMTHPIPPPLTAIVSRPFLV